MNVAQQPLPVREELVPAAGGIKLLVRSWLPAEPARGIVAIVHGFKSHSGHYFWAADQLVASGFAVYAVDLRGRGKSGGERFYVEKLDDYLGDVRQLVDLARSRHADVPVFLLGHSAGGVISTVFTLDNQAQLAGLICESFAFEVPAPGFVLAAVKWLSRIAPRLKVLKLPNADFSRESHVVAAMNKDPLLADEVQPAHTVAEMVGANARLRREFPQIKLPVLILHGTADKVTLPKGSQAFFKAAGAADKTLKLYDGHVHDLLNDTGRERVMADIKQWLLAHLAQ
jgi:acylglycerol lipase